MGGKHKQANRIKNNARPSSSSHSAELLGNTVPTFFGFSTLKTGAPAIPGFISEDASYSINSDFQVLFKQMNKKDPTTRFKALQQFTDLVNNTDVEEIKTVLPLWSRTYCLLCTDVDHKVRECSHKAHKAVVSKVKKMIAPHLKELAGPWFTSQYDTYAPAASAATLSFEEAFPSSKLNKAIMFCQEEILSYIYDNLINHTPQSLCNVNTTSPEDMQAKYERTILASFQGYSLYLQKLSPDQIEEAIDSNKKLLSNSKFWKHAKSKVPSIRTCFYRTLITLCQRATFLLKEVSTQLSSAIFNNLQESDPMVLHAVWEAALNVLVTSEDCWSHINVEKQLFTKLCSILRSGGRNVFTIYPNILPLLSKLPVDALKDKEAFYTSLLENMISGMESSLCSQSISEGKMVANTFVECLKFIILQNASNEEFCTSLVVNLLVPTLDKFASERVRGTVKIPFATQTSYLIRYWHLNRGKGFPVYDGLVCKFFESLAVLYAKQLDSEILQSEINNVLNNQVLLINVFLNPDQFKGKNKDRIKFKDEAEDSPEVFETVTVESSETVCPQELTKFVGGVVALYFHRAVDKPDKSYLAPICQIMRSFGPRLVFDEMVTAVNESTCFKLFSTYLSKWLMCDDMKCDHLVELSFSLAEFVTPDEKEYILEELSSEWLSDSLQCAICRILPKHVNDQYIVNWVRGERFSKCILGLVERFINEEGEEFATQESILVLLKTKCNDGEFMVNSSTVGSIMNILSQRLEEGHHEDHVVALSQGLILNANASHLCQPSFIGLMASLFKLSCCTDDSEQLLNAWRSGLEKFLSAVTAKNFLSEVTDKLSEVIRGLVVSETLDYSLEQIVRNIEIYVELTSGRGELCQVDNAVEIILKLTEKNAKDFAWTSDGFKMLEKCCRIGYEGNENLDLEHLATKGDGAREKSANPWENYPTFNLVPVKACVQWNLYLGHVFNLLFSRESDVFETSTFFKCLSAFGSEESATRDTDTSSSNCSQLKTKDILKDICHFFMTVGFLDCFNKYFAGTIYYRDLHDLSTDLKSVASTLVGNENFAKFKFLPGHCRNYFEELSVWGLVKSTWHDLFDKAVVRPGEDGEHESTVVEKRWNELLEAAGDGKSRPSFREHYLRMLWFIENGYAHRLTENHWNGIFIYVHTCIDEFQKKDQITTGDLLDLLAASRLYLRMKESFRNNHSQPSDLRILPEVCLSWNEVAQNEIYDLLVPVWRKMAKDWCDKKDVPADWFIVLQSISDAVIAGLPTRKCGQVEESVDVMIECSRLMMSSHAVIQITAFRLCLSTIPDLVKVDTEVFGNNMFKMFQDEKDGSANSGKSTNDDWTIKNLAKEIAENQGIVEILLSDFYIGDYCTVEPFTDSFTYTYSYLLLWCFLLKTCGAAHSSLRVQYGAWLQDSGYTSVLLDSVFKLMPQVVLHGTEPDEDCQKYFEDHVSLNFHEPVHSGFIEETACLVYRLFLQILPNYVREWWKQTENKSSGLVDRVTRLYVSPILILNELKNVQQDKESGLDNIEIKTYPNSREVIATYTIDDIKMDLIMTLPQNYPLGTAKIESSNVVVGTTKWRNLLFQICKYLIHQNGTIWDALVIWKNNLDKKFEGVEECYICFSILQGSTFEIPRLCCHTCKKKFHSNCLYKWFSTSNNSTCPICRNLF